MKSLLHGVNVRRFHGPFRSVDANGTELRNVARYFVDTVGADGQRDRYHWDLTTRDPRGWRFFSYETSMGTSIGMYSSRLETASRLLHPATHSERLVTVEACAKNLGNGVISELP